MAVFTFFARTRSTGPGFAPGRGAGGNITGLLARKAFSFSRNGGTSATRKGKQQQVDSHTSTTPLHSGEQISTGPMPIAMERKSGTRSKMNGKHLLALPETQILMGSHGRHQAGGISMIPVFCHCAS